MPTKIRRSHKPPLKVQLQVHSQHPLRRRLKQRLMQEPKQRRTKALMRRQKKARSPKKERRERRPIHLQLQKRVPKQEADPLALPALGPGPRAARNIIEDISEIESGVPKAEKKVTMALMSLQQLKTILPIAKRWTKSWVSAVA